MDFRDIISILVNVVMVVILIIIAVKDAKGKIIDKKLLFILLIVSVPAVYANNEISVTGAFAAMAIIFLILSFVCYASNKGIGWGDVELCACIALYLGLERAFVMLAISMLLCGLPAIVLMLSGKVSRHREVPFSPFAAMGTIAALLL